MLMTSARLVSAACRATHVLRRGSGSEDSHTHTKSSSRHAGQSHSGRSQGPPRLVDGPRIEVASWLGRWACPVLGTCPLTPRTCWWSGSSWRQDGARAAVPAHPACRLWPHSHHRSPLGRDAGKRELLQTTTGLLTSQLSPRHPTSEKI